jgi:hypothetical protein
MNSGVPALTETTRRAIRLLSDELGVVETVRFLNQFSGGLGDYTKDREALFGNLTLEEIVADIRKARRPNKDAAPERGHKPVRARPIRSHRGRGG